MKKIMTNGSGSVADFVKNLPDLAPSEFEIKNRKHPKLNQNQQDYYYVVKLSNGKTAILQAGVLVRAQEEGLNVFTAPPVPGQEAELNPGVLLGVKNGRWEVAVA